MSAAERETPRFEIGPDTWIDPDFSRAGAGRARGLRHLTTPLPPRPEEVAPEELAVEYLRAVGPRFYGLTGDQLDVLEARQDAAASSDGYWLRRPVARRILFGDAGAAGEIVVLAFQQVVKAVGFPEADVPGAGVRVVLRRSAGNQATPRYQVISSNAFLLPPETQLPAFRTEGARLVETFAAESARIAFIERLLPNFVDRIVQGSEEEPGSHFAPIQIPADDRAGEPAALGVEIEFLLRSSPAAADLQPRPAEQGGSHQGSTAARPEPQPVPHRLIADFEGSNETPRLRLLQALVANCAAPSGLVFRRDPPSQTGDPSLVPDSFAQILDPHSESVTLTDLDGPIGGVQALRGGFVEIMGSDPGGAQPNPIGIAPPTAGAAPFAFNFSSRTDNFAAVSAYHHCTCALRLAADFGCAEGTYFQAGQFPIRVAHRGPIILPNPSTSAVPYVDAQVFGVNAQVLRDVAQPATAPGAVMAMHFALGDYSSLKTLPIFDSATTATDALGAASDVRWVWHEMGHALLVAATGSLELPFAHSVGDSLAAILSDPGSEFARKSWNRDGLAIRGVTFPWIAEPLRNHDRSPADGWAWYGTIGQPPYPPAFDPNGYLAEQILSSSLFRLYKAAGGDAIISSSGEPDRPRRLRAAHRVAYLIMWALVPLGPIATPPIPLPSPMPNVTTAEALVTALMAIEASFTTFNYDGVDWLDGMLFKLIPWAFERQGLFPPIAGPLPWNASGEPPAVDVFLEDEAQRGGHYDFSDRWQADPNEVRLVPPGGGAVPVPGQDNEIHIRVHNRGTAMAVGVVARGWASAAGINGAIWDRTTWTPLGNTPAVNVPPGGVADLDPLIWTPDAGGIRAVLVEVASPGDRSLLYGPSGFVVGAGPTPVAELVPFDNNLGYRVWMVP